MKKVLFAALALAVSMTGFAQRAVVSNTAKNASVTVEKPSALRTISGADVQGIQFTTPQTMVNANHQGSPSPAIDTDHRIEQTIFT